MKTGDTVYIKDFNDLSAKDKKRYYRAGILPSMPGRIEFIQQCKQVCRQVLINFLNGKQLWCSEKTLEPMNETPRLTADPDFSDVKEVIEKINKNTA